MKNNDPSMPWNDPVFENDPLAPHNDPARRDDPFEPWNSPSGSVNDLDEDDRSYYNY